MSSLPARRQELVQMAMEDWANALGVERARIGPTGSKSTIVEVAELPNDSLGLAHCRPMMDSHLEIVDWLEDDDWRRVVRHEIGHHLGCRDLGEPGHVMTEEFQDSSLEITQTDIDCAHW